MSPEQVNLQQRIAAGQIGAAPKPRTVARNKANFAQVLDQAKGSVRFSAHARTRLHSRNITMTDEILGKLDKAVENAERKGSRDSLILLSDLAFVVNVPNRTVITAMDGKTMKDNIVTNIDSTVIAG